MNAAVIYNYEQPTSLPIIDSVSDSLNFQAKLLLEGTAKEWRVSINNEIDKCNKAAQKVAGLSIDLQKAAGYRPDPKNKKEDEKKRDEAKREFYHRIDSTFRLWLAELKVNDNDDTAVEQYMKKLDTDLRKIALRLGKEMVAQVSDKAIFGYMKLNEKGKERFSAAEALNKYEDEIKQIFPKKQ